MCQRFGVRTMWSFTSMCQETTTDNSVMVYMTSSSVSHLCVSKFIVPILLGFSDDWLCLVSAFSMHCVVF